MSKVRMIGDTEGERAVIQGQARDIDSEQAILGSIFLYPDVFLKIKDILSTDHFFSQAHKIIYGAMARLYEDGYPIEPMSVMSEINKFGEMDLVCDVSGRSGATYIAWLFEAGPIAHHAESYARRIIEAAAIRGRLVQAQQHLRLVQSGAGADDIEEFLKDSLKNLRGGCDCEPKYVPKTLSELEHAKFAPIKWIVPDLLAEGCTILCAPPKIGKSTIALCVGLAAAMGGRALGAIDVEKCGVLYLSLDDVSEKRMQARVARQLPPGAGWPDNFRYLTAYPRADEGGLRMLERDIILNEGCRLVIIDTIKMFRTRNPRRNANAYENDYEVLHPISEMANKNGCAILLIHHTTKADHADIFDKISGSMGMQGAVDDLWMMSRMRDGSFVLATRGRNLDERQHAIVRDAATMTWHLAGEAREPQSTLERRVLLDVFKKNPDCIYTPALVERETGLRIQFIRETLPVMARDGLIDKVAYGKYRLSECVRR